MVTHNLPSLSGIALNFQGADAPDWVQLIPAGPAIRGRDGRNWVMPRPEAVALCFDGAKEPQIDIEHSSQHKAPKGEPAPAVGWIKELEVRDGSIWGRVEWTAEGAAAVTSRAYRYLSPVFAYQVGSGEIARIVSAGLTNSPNLEMAALNAAEQEIADMDTAVLEALGLKPTATAADAVLAINAMKQAEQVALNAAKLPDPEKFVPKADHQLALNRIAAFETKDKASHELAINAAVDAAIAAGKVAPASKDYHIASCQAEGGLERFTAMVAVAPAIAPSNVLKDKRPEAEGQALNAEELAVCQMGSFTKEAFAAAKAAQAKKE